MVASSQRLKGNEKQNFLQKEQFQFRFLTLFLSWKFISPANNVSMVYHCIKFFKKIPKGILKHNNQNTFRNENKTAEQFPI